MDVEEYKRMAKSMIDYTALYLQTIGDRPVHPKVEPGFLSKLIVEDEAPQDPHSWQQVLQDVERIIIPGLLHLRSPHNHAYFPSESSTAAVCAGILCQVLGTVTSTWDASPVGTELEVKVMDWLGKALQLPQDFLSTGGGGASILTSMSESTLVNLVAARKRKLGQIKQVSGEVDQADITSRLVAYSSDQAHISVEKMCRIADVRYHKVTSDSNNSLSGCTLIKAIEEDRAKGLVPFYVVVSLGTTGSVAFDQLTDIGPVCEKEDLWMHIDAAYAGNYFICPEFRWLLNGVEYASSFSLNASKGLPINYDCTCVWSKHPDDIVRALKVDAPVIIRSQHHTFPDYRHWQVGTTRPFRSLKLWFVLRLFGIKGLQDKLRKDVQMAKKFEQMLEADGRFEVIQKVVLGAVCFKLKGHSNQVNQHLLETLNRDGQIHMCPSICKDVYFLRFVIISQLTRDKDVEFSWCVIRDTANKVLEWTSSRL